MAKTNRMLKSKFLLLIVIAVFIGGVSQKTNASKTSKDKSVSTMKTNNFDCLTPADLDQVREFMSKVKVLLKKHDKKNILEFINFPLEEENDMFADQKRFLAVYYETFSKYFSKSTIPPDEKFDLKRDEGFAEIEGKAGCYRYYIYNAFPKLEFNVNFSIEKRGGRLKIVALRIIG